MTTQETFQKLSECRLLGFARALHEQLDHAESYEHLTFEDRVGVLIDREWTDREARSLTRRLQLARLRDRGACIEDFDFRHPRGLDRTLIQRLATCEWISKHQNLIVTGSTGCGKTFVICALGHKACRAGYSVLYRRVPRLLHELHAARADGSFPRLLARWAKTDLLILDDWGLAPLGTPERHDLLEVIEDRHTDRSTVIAAQLPVKDWHKYIGDPQVADAALDRVVHAAHQITLKGESMRKKRSSLTSTETTSAT
jgi:DNA replication protein DnaC